MTDHKARALEDPAERRALVHATLYLAEQQRIANEIEFLKFALAENATITDEAGLQALADRVVEGLGL